MRPKFILKGTKLNYIELGRLRFLDTFNYFKFPLKSLPRLFDIAEESKGFFPHKFHTQETQFFVGDVPDAEQFDYSRMNEKTQQEFTLWHREQQRQICYNLREHLITYCKTDVRILRKSIIIFHNEIMAETQGIAPFQNSITISSLVNRIFRSKHLNFYSNNLTATPTYAWRLADKQSEIALKWLHFLSLRSSVPIQSSYNGREIKIYVDFNRFYKVDGYQQMPNGEKYVYEFHGCYWHAHECEMTRSKTVNKENVLRREATEHKKKILESLGYNYVQTYECEFNSLLKQHSEAREMIKDLNFNCIKSRDFFYGGNCDVTCVYAKASDTHVIRHIDFCSLYPFVNKVCLFTVFK